MSRSRSMAFSAARSTSMLSCPLLFFVGRAVGLDLDDSLRDVRQRGSPLGAVRLDDDRVVLDVTNARNGLLAHQPQLHEPAAVAA